MEHAFSRIVAVFTAVVMFFLAPLMINIQRSENVTQLAVMQCTVEFVDMVRNTSVMTKEMYQQYENRVRKLKSGQEIQMVHTAYSLDAQNQGVQKKQIVKTEQEIVEKLENGEAYEFQMGDYFRVEVKNSSGGFHVFFGGDNPATINGSTYVYYGGSIRYED